MTTTHWLGGIFGFVLGVILVNAAIEVVRRMTGTEIDTRIADAIRPNTPPSPAA